MAQVPFFVVLLLPLGEGESCTALCARYFNVWHDSFLHESTTGGSASIACPKRLYFSLHAGMVQKHFELILNEGVS